MAACHLTAPNVVVSQVLPGTTGIFDIYDLCFHAYFIQIGDKCLALTHLMAWTLWPSAVFQHALGLWQYFQIQGAGALLGIHKTSLACKGVMHKMQ